MRVWHSCVVAAGASAGSLRDRPHADCKNVQMHKQYVLRKLLLSLWPLKNNHAVSWRPERAKTVFAFLIPFNLPFHFFFGINNLERKTLIKIIEDHKKKLPLEILIKKSIIRTVFLKPRYLFCKRKFIPIWLICKYVFTEEGYKCNWICEFKFFIYNTFKKNCIYVHIYVRSWIYNIIWF